MKNNTLSGIFGKLIVLALIALTTVVTGFQVRATGAVSKSDSDQSRIIGFWQLERSREDRSAFESNATFLALPIKFAPLTLILAADENISEITINEEFKEFVQTQTLRTDGTISTKNSQAAGLVTAKAYWKNKKLIVETSTASGERLNKTFEVSGDRTRLIVTLKLTAENPAKALIVRRVYNRMNDRDPIALPLAGISQLPL